MIRVLLTKSFHKGDIEYLRSRLDRAVELVFPDSFSEAGVLSKIEGADVMFGGMLTPQVVRRAKHVKFFQIPWTGVDNLDFELLNAHRVTVCNSHSNAVIVAEHGLAMLLAAAKKIPYHDQQLRLGNWNRVNAAGNDVSPFSRRVSGSRVLLVGYGAIGRAMHRLLTGFMCRISVVNTSGALPTDTKLPIDDVFTSAELDEAVLTSEFVFVAVPLTNNTRSMFGADLFSLMDNDAILVNISRGQVIDEDALFDALKNNQIAGAAIDTWFNYPTTSEPKQFPSCNHPFESLDNLVLSPHRAGYVQGGFPHLDDAIDNLNRAVAGKPLINVVSTAREY